MLKESMGWCGKLPNYADIIRSNQLVDVQNALMSWLAKGQDHIGEQFIKSNEVSTIYYFSWKVRFLITSGFMGYLFQVMIVVVGLSHL